MKWRVITVLLAIQVSAQARADLPSASALAPADQVCRQAIASAERAHGIPPHLLAAVARVESGRRDQVSGTFNPWPWTINMDGQGSFYDNEMQAVTAAQAMRPHVTRSIDIGCMQISLTHHPEAFATLTQAFDPTANAEFGASFLVQLFEKTGSWPRAVEMYHSATPELGADYGRKVYAALPEEQRIAGASPATQATPVAHPWAGLFASLPSPLGGHQQLGRILTRPIGAAGTSAPGRTLEMYRSMPVRLAWTGH
jgi:hypothetical protein